MRAKALTSALLLLTLSGCSSAFYYPSRALYFPPSKIGYTAQEIQMVSGDGTKLFGWFFPAKAEHPKGTLVQFHGNAENMSSHYLSLVWLVKEGYNLFVFDYRGYGKSEGDPDQKGTYLDGLTALDQAWELNQKNGNGTFVIYAQSLGGAIAMRALQDFKHQDETNLIVMDSTFVSYKDVAQKKLASNWLTWVFSPLGSLLVSDEYSAEPYLKETRVPLLVIHDEHDPAVPFGAGEKTFDESTHATSKDFWKLDQGQHIGVFANPKSPYRAKFLKLLSGLKR